MEPDLPGQLEEQDLEDSQILKEETQQDFQIHKHKITAYAQNAEQESHIQEVRPVTQ